MAMAELDTRTSDDRLDMDAEKTISTMTSTSATGRPEVVMKCGMILSQIGPLAPIRSAGSFGP